MIMSRESEQRAAYLASLEHTGKTLQQAEAEAARIEAEGVTPTPGGPE